MCVRKWDKPIGYDEKVKKYIENRIMSRYSDYADWKYIQENIQLQNDVSGTPSYKELVRIIF